MGGSEGKAMTLGYALRTFLIRAMLFPLLLATAFSAAIHDRNRQGYGGRRLQADPRQRFHQLLFGLRDR
jgi:hypothetical protein